MTLDGVTEDRGLIDIYRVTLYPLTLSSGHRLFREGGDRTTLTLTDAKMTSTPVVILTYEPAGETAAGPSARGEQ